MCMMPTYSTLHPQNHPVPSAGDDGPALECRGGTIKHKHWSYLVKQQPMCVRGMMFYTVRARHSTKGGIVHTSPADATEKAQQVCIGQHVALVITHGFDKLDEPNGCICVDDTCLTIKTESIMMHN